MVAQFADVCTRGSYSTMGILFACVPPAKFRGQEKRHSSTAVLQDCCAECHAVTKIPCMLLCCYALRALPACQICIDLMTT